MNKYFIRISLIALTASLLCLTACENEETGGETAYTPNLTVSKAVISATTDGGSYKFTYTIGNPADDGQLTCASGESWITVSDYSSGTVNFTVDGNTAEQVRSGYITLSYTASTGSAGEQVLIVQNAVNAPSLSVQPTAVVASKSGGDYDFSYSVTDPLGNGSLSCEADADWIGEFDYSADGTVGFTVAKSEVNEIREGAITVTYANANGSVSEIVAVVQESADIPVLSVQSRNLAISSVEGTYSFTYSIANAVSTGVLTLDAEMDWVSELTGSDGIVSFHASTNGPEEKRGGYINLTYTYEGGDPVTTRVYVSQNATPTLTVNTTDITAYFKGFTYKFTYGLLNEEEDGEVVCSTSADWLKDFDYSTTWTVGFTVTANETESARTADITVSYKYGGTAVTQTVTVYQDCTGPVYTDIIGTYDAAGDIYISSSVADYSTWTIKIYENQDDPSTIIIDGLSPDTAGKYPSSSAYVATASMNSDGQITIESQFTGYAYAFTGDYFGWVPCTSYVEGKGWAYNLNVNTCTLTYDSTTETWTSDYGMFLAFFSVYQDFSSFCGFWDVINPGFTIKKVSSSTSSAGTASVKAPSKDNFHTDFIRE